MATNNYVSNSGGGFQGPQNDYWMYGLGDMVPAQNEAAHQADQVRQQFTQNLDAQKAQQMQKEWMDAKGERDAAGDAAKAKSQLELLGSQQGIAEAPLRAKKSMADIYDSMDQAKRDKMTKELSFLAENGRNMKTQLDSTQDPAQKNQIWKKWMSVYGGDTEGIENWTPQNEQKLTSMYQNFVNNPELQRKMLEDRNKFQNNIDVANAKGEFGLQRQALANQKPSSYNPATKIVSTQPGKQNGVSGVWQFYEEGEPKWRPLPEGTTSPEQEKSNNIARGAQKELDTILEGAKALGLTEDMLKLTPAYIAAKKKIAESNVTNTPKAVVSPTGNKPTVKPLPAGIPSGSKLIGHTPEGKEVYSINGKNHVAN